MKSTKLLPVMIFTLCLFVSLNPSTPALAGSDSFGLEVHSDGPIILFADHYLSDKWMIHPWFVPSAQSNILIRYALSVPGFDKFEFGIGPTWATTDGVEKIRFFSNELDFTLPLGHGMLWQAYNLAQFSSDNQSPDSALLRWQIKLGQSKLGLFNENRLKEGSDTQIFVGAYYNLAPVRYLSTCKLVWTFNLDHPDEQFVAWIAEF